MAYSGLAKYYDKLIEYPYAWVADIALSGLKGNKALDLFCGTGRFTFELASRGLTTQGSDISEEMLNIAIANARQKGLSIIFKKENALKFAYNSKYDLISATSDGLNYIKDGDLNAFFKRVSQALNDGGRFVFDVSTDYKLKNKLGNNLFYYDQDDLVYFWRNSFREKDGSVKMELTFFEKTQDGSYIRTDDEQRQYSHSIESIKVVAECYGLSVDATYDLDSKSIAHSRSQRILFVMSKSND